MVISHCQDHGSVACALRSGLLKTELKENNHKTSLEDTIWQHTSTFKQPDFAGRSYRTHSRPLDGCGRLDQKTSLAWNYRSETQTNTSLVNQLENTRDCQQVSAHGETLLHRITKTVQAKPPEKAEKLTLSPRHAQDSQVVD